MKKHIIILLLSLFLFNCGSKKQMSVKQENVFMWEASNIYFLLTDRFKNGDTLNDKIIERNKTTGFTQRKLQSCTVVKHMLQES